MTEPVYLVPKKRYTYWTPKWLHETKFGVSTSPFPSFWFVQLGKYAEAVLQKYKKIGGKQSEAVVLAKGVSELPNEVRAAFDPLKKRPSPKARKRMAAQKKAQKNA
mmetsp:Transcript_9065/g.14341  ORF Transcript_9065/g.14341 Transcript_9065/m.14341 type:complete len:106 (-) Transcript_9065:901-1218(-)